MRVELAIDAMEVRLGALGGSLIAAATGYTVLRLAPAGAPEPEQAPADEPPGAGQSD